MNENTAMPSSCFLTTIDFCTMSNQVSTVCCMFNVQWFGVCLEDFQKRLSDLVMIAPCHQYYLPKKCKEIFKKSQPPIDSKIQLDYLFDE